MRINSVVALALSTLAFSTVVVAQAPQPRPGGGQQSAGPVQTIDAKTGGLQKLDGFMPLYWDEKSGSLWMEINKWNSEMLYSTGLAAGLGSNDIGLDRGQSGQGRVVKFQRMRSRSCGASPSARRRKGACSSMRPTSSSVTRTT